MSHTYVILKVSKDFFEDLREKLEAAGYHQAFHETSKGLVIDMHGIALQAEKDKEYE